MNEFLIYLVKANVALALFYFGYRFLLQNLTFYRLNRYYFLLALVFAVLYPAVDWHAYFQERGELPATLIGLAPEWQGAALPKESLGLGDVLEFLFWTAALLFAGRLGIQLLGIWRIHRRSTPACWNVYAYRSSADDIIPFSFWKSVYMNPGRHSENEYEQILKHEYVHVQQMHSLDILITELAVVIFWYNPFCWLLRHAVRENIEFITDRRVLASGIDKKSYQYSLLNISTLSIQPVLGTQFNLKNLKKRIRMMNKKNSSALHLSKYALILPVVLAGSLVFGLSHAGQDDLLSMEAKPFESSIDTNKYQESQKENPTTMVHLDRQQDTLKMKAVKSTEVPAGKSDTSKQKPLYVLDGKILSSELDQVESNNIAKVEVLKGESAEALYGEKGKHGAILVTTKSKSTEIKSVPRKSGSDERTFGRALADQKPVIYIDGIKSSRSELEYIPSSWIKSMEVYKGDRAIELYGPEAKDGAIRVTTHQRVSVNIPGIDGDTTVIAGYLTKTRYSPEKKSIGRSKDSKMAIDSVDKNTTLFVNGKVVSVKEFKKIDPEAFSTVEIRREEDYITLHGTRVKGGVVEAWLK